MMNLSFVDRGKTVVKAKLHNKYFWPNVAPKVRIHDIHFKFNPSNSHWNV